MIINQRRAVLEDVLHCWRTRGSEAAVTEAARSSDIAVLVELIDAFNHTPAVWNLTLCAAILPQIEPLCIQQLTNIRVKATLLADRMNKSQSHEFTALMQIFDDTLSPS
ncbi:unnamed protein product [Onchocerca flexuosa]|uniref:Katanin_con80 domain-containing protein n=1 Tax=Onchocerca flexuosa TaxID=387005 RepID=A0A183I837_9BILA|nr:unnamed protein product [Onchocerca flexuosa]